ncbi:MAG: sugar ABC transporter permease, partial [Betaproteobacteria bacterium]|nr:sugar ABC transporter permease [Betaproteobacteria bacterium]
SPAGAVSGAEAVLGFALALMTTRITRGRVLYRTVFLLPILRAGHRHRRHLEADVQLRLRRPQPDAGHLRTGAGRLAWQRRGRHCSAVIVVDVWH